MMRDQRLMMRQEYNHNSSEGGTDGMVTPVSKLTASIKKKMEDLPTMDTPYNPCIFKIPRDLRSVNEKAYTPCRVAIGPYHADDPALKPMEHNKLRFLRSFISRFGHQLEDDVAMMASANIVDIARQCYANIQDLKDDRLAEMMLTDSAFIIEFLLSCNNMNARVAMEIRRDLLLLENQLPYFILELLLDFTFHNEELLHCIVLYLFNMSNPIERYKCQRTWTTPAHTISRIGSTPIMHLVHLMILLLQDNTGVGEGSGRDGGHEDTNDIVGHDGEDSNDCYALVSISAAELHEAGVKFKRITSENQGQHSLLKIQFSDGVLEMHHLTLDELTESFFRNLMAFEQYYLNTFNLTSYLYFMDHLIDTVRDVQILHRSNVVENWLESKDNVTTVFNTISKHTITRCHPELGKVINNMKQYAGRPWNTWKAKLGRDYFGSPWAVISFLAAVTLLVLTFLQTFASLR